jgi:hypothetical protein
VADLILGVAENNKMVMEARLSPAEIADLLHECEEVKWSPHTFYVRAAAEIILDGCEAILNKPL